jgi:hypothetical protein
MCKLPLQVRYRSVIAIKPCHCCIQRLRRYSNHFFSSISVCPGLLQRLPLGPVSIWCSSSFILLINVVGFPSVMSGEWSNETGSACIIYHLLIRKIRNSLVHIVSGLRSVLLMIWSSILDIENIFSLLHIVRTDVRSTRGCIQGLLGTLARGVKWPEHGAVHQLGLARSLRMREAVSPLGSYVVVARCLTRQKDNFTSLTYMYKRAIKE